ncbi:uncharacterized protein ACIB01_016035 isoform 2-T3 [Guaruba guarouba]
MGQGSGAKTCCSWTHFLANPEDLLTPLRWSSCCCLLLRAALLGQNSVLELLKSKPVKRKDNTPHPEVRSLLPSSLGFSNCSERGRNKEQS